MNIRQIKPKSKKGLTLIEIVVGVTIVVIVFASTLGAMVSGYTTTLKNADENKAAIKSAAVNEIIMKTISNLNLEDEASVNDIINTINDSNNVIKVAAEKECSNIKYVSYGDFLKEAKGDEQYTIIAEQTSDITSGSTKKTVKGIIIKTAVKSSSGFVSNETFVPYASI